MIKLIITILVFCSGISLGIGYGKNIGRQEMEKEAVEHNYGYRRFIMAGVHDHFVFTWKDDPYYPMREDRN